MVSKLVVTLMMRPQPRLIMGSAANRAIRNAPMALIATMRRQPSGSASKNLIRASRCPAAVDMLMPAQLISTESPQHLLNGMPAICGLGHIGDGIEEFSGRHWFGREAIETARIDIDARDLGAGACERARHHAPHAVRRSSDDGH